MQTLRPQRTEGGFTLAELLVVIIVIGILAAIAVPVFLNQRKRANDAAVKSDLRGVAIAMEEAVIDLGVYPSSIPAYNGSEGVTVSFGDMPDLPQHVLDFLEYYHACNAQPGFRCEITDAYHEPGILAIYWGEYMSLFTPNVRVSDIDLFPYSGVDSRIPAAGTPMFPDHDGNSYCIQGEHVNGSGVFHVSSETGGVQSGPCA